MQRLASLFWILSLFAQTTLALAQQNQITAVNFSGSQSEWVVLDLAAATPHRYFTLKNPSRLVVDFDNTALPASLRQPSAEHPLIAGIRSGIRDNKNLRMVFELKADADAKSVVINKAGVTQIQIELKAKTPPVVTAKLEKAAQPVTPAKKQPLQDTVALLPKTPTVKTSTKAKGRDIVIAIDAGHGGKDVGAQGANGTQEKDVVFAIAKRLESMVNRQPGMKALMIRDGDYFVKLRERVRIAQAAKADLFVSIHADAFSDASAHGASVYTLANKGASSAGARYLADSENAADLHDGGDKDDTLASVLMDLSQSAAKQASHNIGSKVLSSVKNVGHLHRTSVQKAGFVVLKSADIPSILVETAFISNPAEEQRLNTRAYQDKMASAVFGGIISHFRQYAPANTLMAQLSKSGKAAKLAANDVAVEQAPKAVAAVTAAEKVRNIARADVDDGSAIVTASSKSQHVIGRGETLSGIAQQYGVSMRELRLSNGMSDGNVKVGQVLQIPRSS